MHLLRLLRAARSAVKIYFGRRSVLPDLSILPPQFVVFDLETTGLSASHDEIIEIGAILVNRDSDVHQTLRALVKPRRTIPPRIRELGAIRRRHHRRPAAGRVDNAV